MRRKEHFLFIPAYVTLHYSKLYVVCSKSKDVEGREIKMLENKWNLYLLRTFTNRHLLTRNLDRFASSGMPLQQCSFKYKGGKNNITCEWMLLQSANVWHRNDNFNFGTTQGIYSDILLYYVDKIPAEKKGCE